MQMYISFLFLMLFIFVSSAPVPVLSAPVQYVQIGTGPSEGNYFKIGGILSSILSKPLGARTCERAGACGLKGMIFTTKSTRGSSDNLKLLLERNVDLALVQQDIYEQLDSSDKARLHVCGSLFNDQPHIVTRATDAYQNVMDLKSKKVAFGTKDAAVAESMKRLLETQGLKPSQYVYEMLTPGQGSEALESKKADALFLISNYPVPVLRALSRKQSLRLLDLKSSVYQSITIPADTYGHALKCTTIGIPVLLIGRHEMGADFYEQLRDSIWNVTNQKYLSERWRGGQLTTQREKIDKIQNKNM